MASVPNDPRPVLGRVDKAGRLISADPELEALQREAGGEIGKALALPQVAAVAELARRLGTSVARPAIAASLEHDIDLWVRATPEGDDVALSLEGWTERAPAGPRLASLLGGGGESEAAQSRREWAADEELRLIMLSGDLAEHLGVDLAETAGQPLTRVFRLEEDEAGEMPLISALASRRAFTGQRARSRGDDSREIVLSGEVVTGADGGFAGFRGTAEFRGPLPKSLPRADFGLRPCARRGAPLSARPDHRKRRADCRARRRPAAQRLCELRQRHRYRGEAFAVGHPLDERRPAQGTAPSTSVLWRPKQW
jgi:hypothetical protein